MGFNSGFKVLMGTGEISPMVKEVGT